MKKISVVALGLLALSAQAFAAGALPSSNDITIWSLKQMAEDKKFDELNDLFDNHGLTLTKLPSGYAAGEGARVGTVDLAAAVLDVLTGATWRGKVFFDSDSATESQGVNRIRSTSLGSLNDIVPQAHFVTRLVDHDPLAPGTVSNQVILNYAHSDSQKNGAPLPGRTTPIERALDYLPVYDVMVAVQGKYGPVFIGKTWLGTYAKQAPFEFSQTSLLPKGTLVAWFFLDFNDGALAEQKSSHWDSSVENRLSPLPRSTAATRAGM